MSTPGFVATPEIAAVHVWPARVEDLRIHRAYLLRLAALDNEVDLADTSRPSSNELSLLGRGFTRVLLGCYLGLPAAQITFGQGKFGKPYVAALEARPPLHFNLSHSGDYLLLAVSLAGEVGIDIQVIRPLPDAARLVQRFFSPEERALFPTLPADQRLRTFYRWWTCKEAYGKAIGQGLAGQLASFNAAQCLETGRVVAGAHGVEWRVWELAIADGYAAALCVEGTPAIIRLLTTAESASLLADCALS